MKHQFLVGFIVVICAFIVPLIIWPVCTTCGVPSWEPDTTYRRAMTYAFLLGSGLTMIFLDVLSGYLKTCDLP